MPRNTPEEMAEQYESLTHGEKREVSALVESLWESLDSPLAQGERTHKLMGRLTHHEDEKPPLYFMTVELWDKQLLRADRFLGRCTTDEQGRFEIHYAPESGRRKISRPCLKVFETHHTYLVTGEIIARMHMIDHIELPEAVTADRHDCGSIAIPYWEYAIGTLMPRVMTPAGNEPPQEYAKGRIAALERNLSELSTVKRKLDRMAMQGDSGLTLQAVQSHFPDNMTLRMEREQPGSSRSDEHFGRRVLNGFNPVLFTRDPAGKYQVRFNWDECELNGRYDLPNVDARFVLRDGQLCPVQITLQFRKPDHLAPVPRQAQWQTAYYQSPLTYIPTGITVQAGQSAGQAPALHLGAPVTYTPADGERWQQAKRVFRMVWAVAGQVDIHLAQLHLNMEQYAVAAWRNLRRNPVRHLLFPHLKEVVIINASGENLIFGPMGILQLATGLTAAGVQDRIRQRMGALDWAGWEPRQPLCETHTFARAGRIYWEILTQYVDQFFAANHSEIVQYWWEVHRFSNDLVAHSVPYHASDMELEDAWVDTGELGAREAPRVEVNGQLRAVRPLTGSDQPGAADLANLKQLCRYVIFQATYVHAHVNHCQYDDGGEISYLSLGLRNGSMGPESDPSIAPLPFDACNTLYIGRYLSQTRYGTVARNEDGDIPPLLVSLLRSRRAEFEALGVDIESIGSRINI